MTGHFAISLVVCLATLNPVPSPALHDSASPSDWLQLRGPAGAGRAEAGVGFPGRLDPKTNLVWKSAVPPGRSSPIVVGDCIVCTAYEADKLSTVCLDRKTGALRWRQDLPVKVLEKTYQHGPASPTPTSDGERIFSLFGSFGIVAYDLQGAEIWRQERELRNNTFGSASSPVIIDGKLIVFSGSEEESLLQALEPASGKILWERRRSGPASSWSTPVAWQGGDQPALLIYEPFHLRACSLKDGSDLWSVPGLADEPITIPQLGSDLIFTTSYNLRTNTEAIGLPEFSALLTECDANGDGTIDATEAKANKSILSRPDADGQGDHPLRMFFRMLDEDKDGLIRENEWPRIHGWIDSWNHANGMIALRPSTDGSPPSLAWEYAVGVPECPTPILVDGRLYAIRNGGVVTCLEASSGTLHFQGRIAPGGPYYASPVSGDGKIYTASARGGIAVLTAEATPRVLSTLDLGEPIWGTPALVDSQVIVRSEKHIWVFQDTQ